MTPTNGQIIAEARRRAKEQNWRMDIEEYVIEVVRENWTPPEPVEPDVLAFREWERAQLPAYTCTEAAYLAGARMAREQERGRANMPIGMAGVLVDRCQRMIHSLPPGVRAQWDAEWGLVALCRAVAAEIAKYMGEA